MTSYYLSELVPTTGLIADYPLANVVAAGNVNYASDYSGNSRDLSQTGAAYPDYVLDVLNGYPCIRFAGEDPLLYTTTPPNPKDIFIVCKYTAAADFGGTYRGLITGETTGDALTGDSTASSTKFFNNGTGTSSYFKSGTAYAAAAMEAPFTNFELVQYGDTAGIAFDGIQLGQQKADITRRWYGDVADLKLYSTQLTAALKRRLNLYYDLKYELFQLNSTTLYFPDPTTTDIGWARFKELPTDWDSVTVGHEYEDGGRSFNEITDTPTITWEIGFTGLSYAQLQIFEAFNKAARRSRSFSLIDKYGVTQTGVRIMRYESDHDAHKSWSNSCSFILAKYP